VRVLVAGGSGFIGRHAVRALLDAGHEVTVVSRHRSELPESVRWVGRDVGAQPLDPADFAGCDAIVNLIGIAIERGANTFARAHVDATEHLVKLGEAVGIGRFVHVSVVAVADAGGPYQETKRIAERRVEQSGLAWTILRPGLVYGPTDDMLSRLIGLVRAAPVFVAPGGRTGPLQVVDVRDVARAIARALEVECERKSFDIVGPQRLSLVELVHEVSDALELTILVVPAPQWTMRSVARLGAALLARPPVTPAQVEMLIAGLYGDPQPARRELMLTPCPITRERICEVADGLPSVPTIRLVTDAEHRRWLGGFARSTAGAAGLASVLLLALPASLLWSSDVFWRVGPVTALAAIIALLAVRLPWRDVLRPSIAKLGVGLGWAAVMFAVSFAAVKLGRTFVWFADQVDTVYGWTDSYSPAAIVAAVGAVVIAEDIVWRGAIALPLAARLGPIVGTLVAGGLFAAAHLTIGPPVLVAAAFVAATAWGLLAVRTRSLATVIACHLGWDVAMIATMP
jgi:NADH dehydrogenase